MPPRHVHHDRSSRGPPDMPPWIGADPPPTRAGGGDVYSTKGATAMDEPFFILPNGDAEARVQISESGGKATHNVSAAKVLDLINKSESDRRLIRMLTDSVESERQKIRRLMAALADEITK